MKLVISASLLSAMVFYSSLLPFLHSLNLYISAKIHKNYIFLLCNGLLVFIFRNSGLISSSGDEQCGGNGREAEALGVAMEDGSTKIERTVEDGEERENGFIAEEESERSITAAAAAAEEEEEEEEEGEEEEEVGALSNEELNKKCEEFIRKMKAGIKLESQQVPIV